MFVGSVPASSDVVVIAVAAFVGGGVGQKVEPPLLEPELLPLDEPELLPLDEPELPPLDEPELLPLDEPELLPLDDAPPPSAVGVVGDVLEVHAKTSAPSAQTEAIVVALCMAWFLAEEGVAPESRETIRIRPRESNARSTGPVCPAFNVRVLRTYLAQWRAASRAVAASSVIDRGFAAPQRSLTTRYAAHAPATSPFASSAVPRR